MTIKSKIESSMGKPVLASATKLTAMPSMQDGICYLVLGYPTKLVLEVGEMRPCQLTHAHMVQLAYMRDMALGTSPAPAARSRWPA